MIRRNTRWQAGLRHTALLCFLTLASSLLSAEPAKFQIKRPGDASQKAYTQLGEAFANAISAQNKAGLAQMFDMEHFANKTAKTAFTSKKDIKNFVKGLTRQSEEEFLSKIFSTVFNEKGRAKYIRNLHNNKPLIRVDYPEGGHEYIVMDTRKEPQANKLLVTDMFLLSTGRKLSIVLGAASQLMLRPSESVMKKLFGVKEVDNSILKKFKSIGQLRRQGKYKLAYEIVKELPDKVQQDRVVIDMAIQLSQYVSDDEYRKQLSRLDKYYGDDESATFILIDHYYYTGQQDKVLKAINQVINKYGIDAALLNLKANAYYMAKKLPKARDYANKAMKIEPEFEDSYWTMATVLTTEERYGELIKLLKQIESKFGYAFEAGNFTGNDFYAGFIKSRAFKNWMQ